MKHVGENVDNNIYGKTKVEVPFFKAEYGELKEIGRVIISEKADPRWMDPDGCLLMDASSTYYQLPQDHKGGAGKEQGRDSLFIYI